MNAEGERRFGAQAQRSPTGPLRELVFVVVVVDDDNDPSIRSPLFLRWMDARYRPIGKFGTGLSDPSNA